MYFLFFGVSFIIMFLLLSQFFQRWFEKGILKNMVVSLFSLILAIGTAQGFSKVVSPVKPINLNTVHTKNNIVTEQQRVVQEHLQESEQNTRNALLQSEK